MFGLKSPLCRDHGNSDFDNINTILSHSVYNGPPLHLEEKTEANERDDRLFYLELSERKSSSTDSVSCNGHTTDDTGYGTDNDESSCSGASWERASLQGDGGNVTFLQKEGRGSFHSGDYNFLDDLGKSVDFSRMDNIHSVRLKVKKLELEKINQSDSDRVQGHLGRMLCKELVGIIPGHFRTRPRGSSQKGQRLCVRGLVPHSHAAKYSNIHLGDCLRLVNGREVTWDNIDDVFMRVANLQEVSVVIQKATKKPAKVPILTKVRSASDDQELVKLISGVTSGGGDGDSDEGHITPDHCFMVINLDNLKSEDESGDEDLLFCHPTNQSAVTKMRGAFVTLFHSASEVSQSCVRCSCLVHDGKVLNVSYHKEEHFLLLLCFPQDVIPRQSLPSLTGDLLRLIRVLHGSISEAFSNKTNHPELLSLLSLWQSSISSNHQATEPTAETFALSCYSTFHGVQYLPINSKTTDHIENFLNSWEGADFSYLHGSTFGCRRAYTILGSCVFYKSWLLCNHLPKEDLQDLYLFLRHQCFLRLSAEDSIEQLVIWRGVSSTRQTYDLGEEQMFGYTEPVDGKLFWLIVGHKHCILGTLLEARGGSLKKLKTTRPDSLYIEQARATLIQINSLGLHKACKQRNNVHQAVTTADDNQKPASTLVRKPSFYPVTSSPKLSNKPQRKSLLSQGLARKDSIQSDESMDSNSSAGSVRGSQRKLFAEKSWDKIDEEVISSPNVKLTSGKDNCLLHFLHIDKFEGLFVSPEFTAGIQKDVIKNFYRCCTHIKHMFDRYRYRRKPPAQSDVEKDTQLPVSRDFSFSNMREEGIMFTVQQSTESSHEHTLNYWVVGRQRSREEIFVCFRDGTPQNIIELAFRTGFGVKC